MVLRKKNERMHVQCRNCGEMYKPTTVRPGLCPKCKPKSAMDILYAKYKRLKKKNEKRQKGGRKRLKGSSKT